ncbi:hypothetical protein GF391_00535 [Candidatus Uhrbacteria bacterium]|nr:hypothetical protein [Candidatus Uhrbacteria bacterium]
MKLLLARHAETNPNGHDDPQNGGVIGALSEKGKLQAQKMAEHLSAYGVNYIYSSDILRAIATAYIVSDAMPDVTVMLTQDLRIKSNDEANEEFAKRLKKFIYGIKDKYGKETVLIVTHMDALKIMLEIMGADKPGTPPLASVSEFALSAEGFFIPIRVNDDSYLKN